VLYFNATRGDGSKRDHFAKKHSDNTRNTFSHSHTHGLNEFSSEDAATGQTVRRNMSSKSPHPQPLNHSRNILTASRVNNNSRGHLSKQNIVDSVPARRGDEDESAPLTTNNLVSNESLERELFTAGGFGTPELDVMSSEPNLQDALSKNVVQK
jgi:hypothetical protein